MNDVTNAANLGEALENLHKNHAKIEMDEFAKLYAEALEAKETKTGLTARVRQVLMSRNALPEIYQKDDSKMESFVVQKANALRKEFKEANPGMELPSLVRESGGVGRPEVKQKRRQVLTDILGKFAVKVEEKTEEKPQESQPENQTAA